MVEIVTSRNKFDAEILLDAVQLACQYSEVRDELKRLETGSDRPSKMTLMLADAMSLVHEIRADMIEDDQDDALEEKAIRDFENRFGVSV